MEDLLNDFEVYVTAKAIFFDIDLNYLTVDSLKKFRDYCYDLEVRITPIDLDAVYPSDNDMIKRIYELWRDEITILCSKTKEDISKASD